MSKRGNREGSIYQTNDGRWRGSVTLNSGARKYVSGRTREEVAEKLSIILGKNAVGGAISIGGRTLGSWLTTWLEDEVRPSVRQNTYYDYAGIVKNHLRPRMGSRKLVELSAGDISRFHQELLASGVTPSRLLKIHRVLSRSLRIAAKWGYVDRNVATLVSPPRVEEKEPSFLTSSQVSQLLEVIKGSPDESRWLLALLGLRQGEVLGLPWDAVDLDTGELRIKQALQRQSKVGLKIVPPKSRSSRRTVLLPPQVTGALKARRVAQAADRLKCGAVWGNDWDLVFTSPTGLPIDPSADHKAWKSLLSSADIKVMRLHDARHTAATLLLRSGVSTRAAMEWLGHSQVSQTMRYTHVLPEVARDTSSRMGKAMFGDSQT